MSIALLGISIDAVDAARLANFWAQALQRTIDDGATEDFASIAEIGRASCRERVLMPV